jgi:C-terminal processing protease CtpA/Prc
MLSLMLRSYAQSKPGDTYSPLTSFDSLKITAEWGQVYHKPIGLLTNGNCYSACDFFAANLQDAGAVVFGNDMQTGLKYPHQSNIF